MRSAEMFCARVISFLLLAAISSAAMHLLYGRVELTYYNPEYVAFANLSTRRASRRDPTVISLHAIIKHAWGNNITVEVVMFEFLSNEYRRSFVQVSSKVCQAIGKNPFLGPLLKQTEVANKTCPYPPGPYHLTNITVPPSIIPVGFPFRKGRVNLEFTLTENKEIIMGKGQAYFEIGGKF